MTCFAKDLEASGAPRPSSGQTRGFHVQDRIRDARDERSLGTDDHGSTFSDVDDVPSGSGSMVRAAQAGRRYPPGRPTRHRMLGGGRSAGLHGRRVFAAVANEKNLHNLSLSVFWRPPGPAVFMGARHSESETRL